MHFVLRAAGALTLLVSMAVQSDAAEEYVLHKFEKQRLTDEFFAEGAHFGDFNRDGAGDVVYGPFWYEGPDFKERHEYYSPKAYDIAGYSDNFLAYTHDVNKDQWPDILILGFPGKEAFWYENPQGKPGHWKRRTAIPVVDNESPTFTDVTGDGVPEIVCMSGGHLGYAEIPHDDPAQPWKFVPISPNHQFHMFTHGLGVGDVNNDGRIDLMTKDGWYEHPAEPTANGEWPFHEQKFSEAGGSQMFAYDFDGDGDNDVLTSKAAHAYGLSWFESVPDGDEIKFREHQFMGQRPEQNEFGVAFSQLHAVDLADMDGDGVKDVITGKRYWAHGGHDPGAHDPAVLYWFKAVRRDGKVRFIPYEIDNDSGVGTQVVVGDVNGDKLPDVVVGNKKGAFVHLHSADKVDEAAWKAAQPKSLREKAAAIKPVPSPLPGDGFLATDDGGRVLNLDFETGDLADWTPEGEGTAFEGQPIKGDTVHARRPDSTSGHQGEYWLGTFEPTQRDGPQGTLKSKDFVITHPYASFLVGGGAGKALTVEIASRDNGKPLFTASGRNAERMHRAVADLREHQGARVFLRLTDNGSAGWGHLNFDHFRFHDQPPAAEKDEDHVHAADIYPYAGLPAEEAVREMKLPPGFHATLCAAEPDVKQPIAMALDDRGRLWVAEAYEYPVRAPEGKGRDRILIFEDVDGDGKFDKRTVFAEKLNLVSGLEVGFGGVWVGAAPYLLFIPDRNGDDVPDGEPEILLDGWADQDTHETLNTFIWGPDGWLYGCHGVFTHSNVGKPGAPDDQRTPLNAAIWRYHPTRHEFDIFTEGTSNPWGIDFDDHGRAFSTACVIPHLYYNIPGGRYQRQAGSHFNPYTYGDIQTIADHRHYAGDNPHGGNGTSGDAGGGHAHAGAMIYLGGAWPDEYRGRIFMNNIHGQRINTDILKAQGSGYVGSHGPDFLLTGDLASQILNMRYGPDGQAYVIDWYDTNACHHQNIAGHDRSNGRIYKVSYGDSVPAGVDIAPLDDEELVLLSLNKNDWFVRHSRRLLQERAAAGKLAPQTRPRLAKLAATTPDDTRRLRAMWALHVTGGLPAEIIPKLLADESPQVRGWTIRLVGDGKDSLPQDLAAKFAEMARDDASPIVRLDLASRAQQLPAAQRWPILDALVSHAEDAADHNLPLMYWYAAEPLADVDPQRALDWGLACGKTIPMLRTFMLQRIANSESPAALEAVLLKAGASSDAAEQREIVEAVRAGLKGRRRVDAPPAWAKVFAQLRASEDAAVREQAVALGVAFGDAAAIAAMRDVASSTAAPAAARREALEALLAAKDPQLVPTLLSMLNSAKLRDLALAGLALYEDDSVPAAVLTVYPKLPPNEKRTALATLAAREPYAVALLKAVGAGKIPPADLPADLVRHLQNHQHAEIDRLLAEVWGQVRSTPADKAKMIADLTAQLTNPSAPPADRELGRAVFAQTCAACHTLYGAGAKIGPDITGANRADLQYLLSNIVDPSAVITKDYQQSIVRTVDGLVVSGLVKAEDDKSLTIQTPTEVVVIPQDEIDERMLSDESMMPADQLKQFTPEQVAGLFAYLGGASQNPMLATKENQQLFFNGKDLTGWIGNDKLWSVEDGEIVGRSPGLDHNEFLFSDLTAENFALAFDVKLSKDDGKGNSGVQFRSEPLDTGEARGDQADIGPGWWGKLYEESGRGLLWDKSGDQHVRTGDWNRYEIRAEGSRIQTWLNGQPCVDLDDLAGKRRGQFALQLHSGGPLEVRFRNFELEVLD
jgi:putative membrane-bound dehydrogenase-like protein